MSTTVTLTVEQDGIELQMKLTPEDYDGPAPTIEQLIEQAGLSALAAMADFNLFGPDAAPLTDLDSLDGGDTWVKTEPELDVVDRLNEFFPGADEDVIDRDDTALPIEAVEEPFVFVAPSVDKGSNWSSPQPYEVDEDLMARQDAQQHYHTRNLHPSATGDLRTGLGPIQ